MSRRTLTPNTYSAVIAAGRCAYCSLPLEGALEVDHIIPWSRGGSDDERNLAAACWRCNHEKSDQTPDEWAATRRSRGMTWPPANLFELVASMLTEVVTEDLVPTMEAARHEVVELAHDCAVNVRQGGDYEQQRDRLAGLLRGGGPVG